MTMMTRRSLLAMLPLGAVSRFFQVDGLRGLKTPITSHTPDLEQAQKVEFGDRQTEKQWRLAQTYGMSPERFRALIEKEQMATR